MWDGGVDLLASFGHRVWDGGGVLLESSGHQGWDDGIVLLESSGHLVWDGGVDLLESLDIWSGMVVLFYWNLWTSGVGWWCYGIGHLKGISFDHNTNNKGDILCVHHSDT